jgi:hypothetical protein
LPPLTLAVPLLLDAPPVAIENPLPPCPTGPPVALDDAPALHPAASARLDAATNILIIRKYSVSRFGPPLSSHAHQAQHDTRVPGLTGMA